uniref:Type 2 C1q domain-containing protein 6 n=1 Tax=Littorina littorea TaxID=31216 RepID=A0A411DER5_LITLI|nr:type 2 C1q domain-containing protein 6 [Littorina littorea]
MRCVPVVCLLLVLLFQAVLMTREVQGNLRVKRSYDVNTAHPQFLRERPTRQATQMLLMQTKLTSLENRVSALENSQHMAVAFTARISLDRDRNQQGLPLGHQQTVIFNEAITNIGDAYNPHNGIFTAPAAGTFAFFLTQMGVRFSGEIYLDIVKNGVTLDRVFAQGSTDSHDQGSTHVTTHLREGDQVWVRQTRGDAVRGDTWTVFTGYLLHAD